MEQKDWQSIGEVFKAKQTKKRPPAYPWQELALRLISELRVPPEKRNSFFKIARNNPREVLERTLAETRELCQKGEKWLYFLKIINNEQKRFYKR